MTRAFSPRQLGEALGVSESSLKRWADAGLFEVSRTAGGHRRIALDQAIRIIREFNLPIVRPDLLGLAELDAVTSRDRREDLADTLFAALNDGDAVVVRGLVTASFLDGTSVARLCDGAIAEAMRRVGALWKHGDDGIFIEHRATDLCVQAMNQLRGLIPPPATDAPLAIGGAPTGDPFVLGSLMSATVLAGEGWQTSNLGPDTPLPVIEQAAKRREADLVWLSLTARALPSGRAEEIRQTARRLGAAGVRLIVGGEAIPDGLRTGGEQPFVGTSMAELAAFAGGMTARRPTSTADGPGSALRRP